MRPRAPVYRGEVKGPAARDDAVSAAVDALRRRSAVLVTGLPGAGATNLAERAAGTLADDGWRVVRVRGRVGGASRPLGALALSGLGGRAAGTDPLAAALSRVVEGAGRGVVLLVHRADRLDDDSATVLAAASDQPGVHPLLTSLPGRASRVAATRAAGDLPVVTLQTPVLRFDELQVLVNDELRGRAATDVVARIYALSGGMPGPARAIVQAARRAGRLVPTGATWVSSGELRTPELRGVVDTLLEGVDDTHVEALVAVAALGPVDPGALARVAPWQRVAALEDAGLVTLLEAGDTSTVAVVPPLVAEHLVAEEGHLVLHHLRAAAGLDGAASGEPGTTPAVPGLLPPQDSATSGEEVALLGRRLRRTARARHAVRRSEWEASPTAANALVWLDAAVQVAPDEVERALAQVLERIPPQDAAPVRAWQALYLTMVRRDVAAATQVLGAASGLADPTGTVETTRARIGLFGSDVGGPEILAATPGAGADDAAGAEVRYVRGWHLLARGRVEDAAAVFEGARPQPDPLHVDPRAARCLAVLLSGRVGEAIDEAERLLAEGRAKLDGAVIQTSAYVLVLALALGGRTRALREHLWNSLALGAAAPLQPDTRAALLTIGASLAAYDGKIVAARSMADEATAMALPLNPVPLASPPLAAAGVAAATGAGVPAAAHAAWAEVHALLDRDFVSAAVVAAAAAVEVFADEEGVRRAHDAGRAAQGTVLPALATYVAAVASADPDRLEAAARELVDGGLPAHAVWAVVRAGRLHGTRGEHEQAAASLARARAMVPGTGVEIEGLLASAEPSAALTDRELEIARLVAHGATNRQVAAELGLSVRTVDNHLYRVYRKLGASGREALARRMG